ncbi:MAG: 2-C-methyl-D-erythritol 2,4-cyclodiphosphate synthase [Candidatus Dormibacteraeota bacterium]|nr:2-C-methyl-D-erythritol 2,4-cyclodiphosphate synthase [Candidatus Dormibacteraeota bacterium]
MRVGLGQDQHVLSEGRRLVLGGVELEHERGLSGHSDADVLTHAVIDALLGAAGLGTIGEHFPDSDQRYQDVSSLTLLAATSAMLRDRGWRVGNVDSVIVAQQPRLAAHVREMASRLAQVLEVGEERISVKATSPEGAGALGREEAIAASAVALLERSGAPGAAG